MKFVLAAIAFAAPIASAPPAYAEDTKPVAVPQVPASISPATEIVGEGADKVICRREKVLGSRITAKKVCQTAAEWERQRREDQQMAEKVQGARWKGN